MIVSQLALAPLTCGSKRLLVDPAMELGTSKLNRACICNQANQTSIQVYVLVYFKEPFVFFDLLLNFESI